MNHQSCSTVARIIAINVCVVLEHSEYMVAAPAAYDAAYGVLGAAADDDYASRSGAAKSAAMVAAAKALTAMR